MEYGTKFLFVALGTAKDSRVVGANAATENKRDNEIRVIRTSRFSLESALQRLLCSRTFKNNAIC